jgi:hypothetical protein
MMPLRWASLIATLSLLAWAATASADCAWVLWAKMPFPSEGTGWMPGVAFATKGECENALRKYVQDVEQKKAEFMIPACYPDTVDPHGPKGK